MTKCRPTDKMHAVYLRQCHLVQNFLSGVTHRDTHIGPISLPGPL